MQDKLSPQALTANLYRRYFPTVYEHKSSNFLCGPLAAWVNALDEFGRELGRSILEMHAQTRARTVLVI